MAKKNDAEEHAGGLRMYADGHYLLNGARWHTPKQGSPTECEVSGCNRVLGEWRFRDPIAEMEAEEERAADDEVDNLPTPGKAEPAA